MDFSSLLDAFVGSLGELFVPSTFGLLIIGVLIGSLVGLLPGIGAIATMALMLPFTFTMSPFEAFALMLGMYAVVTTTGDLTSILFGVPGTPDCAALVLDGYPMTKRGMAKRAMSADVAAGTIGAIIGAATLALVVPFIRPVILAFGAPETFMLTLIGVVVVAAVSGRSLLRGVVAGGFGLLLAGVGPNAQTGIVRYGFDWAYLLDGIPLVAFAIGLFAIPEVIGLHRTRASVAVKGPSDESTTLQGLQDTVRHFWLVVRSSLIGIGLGVIPGVGSSVGQWTAYAHAMHSSKRPERFGKGAIEGVLAPGATNNSKEGAGLIPTVVFGVPNGGAMAVLLGAFLILGLSPGPSMLTTNLDVTFFMVWVLVAANIIGSLICFLFMGQLAKLTFIRGEVLVPVIVILVFLGAASTTGQIEDLVFALGAGLLAVLMRRYGWPVVPLILGFVLGDGAEKNLNISIGAHGWSFLARPTVIVLGVVVVGFLFFSLRQRRRATAEHEPEPEGEPGSTGGVVLAATALLVSLAAIVWAQQWPPAARLYPQIIGLVVVLCTAVVTVREIRARRAARTLSADPGIGGGEDYPAGLSAPRRAGAATQLSEEPAVADAGATRLSRLAAAVSAPTTASAVGWIVAAAVGVWLLGFVIAAPLFVIAYQRVVSRLSWLTTVAMAVGMEIVTYALFVELLDLPLAWGLVTPW